MDKLNLFGISSFLAGVTSLCMAGFVFIKGGKYRLTRIWSVFALSVAVYGFGSYLGTSAGNASEGLFWWRAAYLGVCSIPFLFVCFIFEFLKIKNRPFMIAAGVCTIGFHSANIFFGKFFMGSATLLFSGHPWARPIYYPYPSGPIHVFFTLFAFVGWVIYAFVEIVRNYHTTTGLKRTQIGYFFIATAIGFIGGSVAFLPCFGLNVYPITNFTVCLYPLIMTYAIFRYRLMDITIAMTRAGIFVAIYTFVLGIPFAVALGLKSRLLDMLGAAWWMFPLVLMAVLATVGPFMYIYLEREAEARLLKEQRQYQQILKQSAVGMTRIRDLKKLIDFIVHIITGVVKISFAAVYLHDEQNREYVFQASRESSGEAVLSVSDKDPLAARLIARHEPLIYEEIKILAQESAEVADNNLEESLRRLSAAVVVPSFLEDRLVGFFVLGDKISRQIYTHDDLNVFQIMATQAALAIENAQFYEGAKRMQDQIAQAEKMATIGTMADGLSHQINNRFHALSLIASDVIDNLKRIAPGNCAPEAEKILSEVTRDLERIRVNVIQGGEVVKGILKYTRKGEDGFEVLWLDQILEEALEMVQYKIQLTEFDMVRDYTRDEAMVYGNFVQLQEVFFNFIENAYDAIMERRSMLKEEGYRGIVTITFKGVIDGLAQIHIADNGMGMLEQNLRKIFTPFFSTKVSTRKGTGLGLYVIRRIITDMHQGKIECESVHKQGTRFIIGLPVGHPNVGV